MKGESVCAHLLFLERLDIDLVITACGAHSLVFEWTVKFNLSSAPASEVSMDILINMEKETIPRIYIRGSRWYIRNHNGEKPAHGSDR